MVLYIEIFTLFLLGLFGVFATSSNIKKIVFLGVMQTSLIMLFIAAGFKRNGAIEPIYTANINNYVNPVPHVLMLTAIVVGLAVSAVGLAIIIKMNNKK